jgi:hypothetical protein
MRFFPIILALTIALTAIPSARAQAPLNISPDHAYAWSENCGWMNWGWNAGGGAPGRVRITSTCLTGFVWWENTGWMSLSHDPYTPPVPSQTYPNTTDQDYGVNVDPSGVLSGYAWAENLGWVNFSGGALASPPNPARIDFAAQRFRGFAWAENAGWINLDDTTLFVGSACSADHNRSGALSVQDVFDFLHDWFAGAPTADFDGDGHSAVADIFAFLTAWFGGC